MSTCPRCDIALVDTEQFGEPVSVCDRCGGRWLTTESLGAIVDAWEPDPITPDQAGEAHLIMPRAAVQEDLRCPDCQRGMEAYNYAVDSGIILEHCLACGKLWVDVGKLELVARTAAASRQGLGQDLKRFGADLRHEELRQDAMEQQDIRTSPAPAGSAIASPFLEGTEK